MSTNMNNKLFISPSVVIESMRDNGYKNTAYAVAELIDNSIQAGANEVFFVVFEKQNKGSNQIDKIAIIDNGSGMPPELLHAALEFGASENRKDSKGMGKFGMGLPNSSISQCKMTEVYSWQEGQLPYYTLLDIDSIKHNKQEHIPYPVQRELPEFLALPFDESFPASGTAVVWSDLDKLHWKTSAALLRNTQDLIGRMYRRMIHNNEVKVCFKSYVITEDSLFGSQYILDKDSPFVANDPMQLINKTTLKTVKDFPTQLLDKPAFKGEEERELIVTLNNGDSGKVIIRSSIITDDLLQSLRETSAGFVGSTEVGRHLKNNIGLSIMRAGRELDLIENFKLFDDKRRDRWMGVEIEFEPVLDEFFGVTNNKQSANKIRPVDMEGVIKQLGCSEPEDAMEKLEAENPEDYQLVKCLNMIESVFDMTWRKVEAMSFSGLKMQNIPDRKIKTDQINLKASFVNKKTATKHHEEVDIKPTKESLAASFKKLADEGLISPEKVPHLITEILENDLRVKFEEVPRPRDQFFGVTVSEGFTLIEINPRHSFYRNFIEKASEDNKDLLKLSLAAWGHMESTAITTDRRRQYEIVRENWGRILSEYLEVDSD